MQEVFGLFREKTHFLYCLLDGVTSITKFIFLMFASSQGSCHVDGVGSWTR